MSCLAIEINTASSNWNQHCINQHQPVGGSMESMGEVWKHHQPVGGSIWPRWQSFLSRRRGLPPEPKFVSHSRPLQHSSDLVCLASTTRPVINGRSTSEPDNTAGEFWNSSSLKKINIHTHWHFPFSRIKTLSLTFNLCLSPPLAWEPSSSSPGFEAAAWLSRSGRRWSSRWPPSSPRWGSSPWTPGAGSSSLPCHPPSSQLTSVWSGHTSLIGKWH